METEKESSFQPVQFGRFLLKERIEVGGMAEIFLAVVQGAMGFEKAVAIKRILPQYAGDTEFLRMFITEAKLVCHLEHPNIVQVLELGEIDSQYFIAMEYVNGIDARRLWRALARRRQRIPVVLALYIVSELLKGLDHAHRAVGPDGQLLGVVHRDISPSNILISYRGQVKIGDFGIAMVQQESSSQAGVLKGKYGYMSPEQVAGMVVDHRSDVFAAGIVLSELVMGRRLFLGRNDFETLDKVMNVRLDILDECLEVLPAEVVQVIRKALQRDVKDRYPSAREFNDDLLELLHGYPERIGAEALAAFIAQHVIPHLDMGPVRRPSGSHPQLMDVTSPVVSGSIVPDDSELVTAPGVEERKAGQAPGSAPQAIPSGEPQGVLPVEGEPATREVPLATREMWAAVLQQSGAHPGPPDDHPDSPFSAMRLSHMDEARSEIQPPEAERPPGHLQQAQEADSGWDQAAETEEDQDGVLTLEALPPVDIASGTPFLMDRTPVVEVEVSGAGEELDLDALEEDELFPFVTPVVPAGAQLPSLDLAGRSPLQHRIVDVKPDFVGQLANRTVAKVLYRFWAAGETGVLALAGPRVNVEHDDEIRALDLLQQRSQALWGPVHKDGEAATETTCEIHFEQGQPDLISAGCGEVELVAALMHKETLAWGRVEMAVQTNPHRGLVAALVSAGALAPLRFTRHLTALVQEQVLDTFCWTEGSFSFYRSAEMVSDIFPSGLSAAELLLRGTARLPAALLDAHFAPLATRQVVPAPRPALEIGAFPDAELARCHELLSASPTVQEALERGAAQLGDHLRAAQLLYLLLECELARLAP